VFSLKGGVGKTTLTYFLGRAQAEASQKPVLLIDADLSGTCLGDLLADTVKWAEAPNLAHLVCGRPEALPEALGAERLPVYVHFPFEPGVEPHRPRRLRATLTGQAAVLFCPSHSESTGELPIDRDVLQALVAGESAGGWVSHVIERLSEATAAVVGELGGILVDHGPGMGALQRVVRQAIAEDRQTHKAASPRRVLLVTSRDGVDLRMCQSFDARLDEGEAEALCWVVNRVQPGQPSTKGGWRDSVDARFRRELASWFSERALPFYEAPEVASGYACSQLGWPLGESHRQALEAIRRELFG
ncbi:MAG TPA: hypothetical protein VH877_21980, partial [Polyangia bacterium]|nr:hypothetical protein [Polyangia bacterium]